MKSEEVQKWVRVQSRKKKKKKRREKVSTFKEVCENLIYNLSKQLSDFIKHHMHFVNDHVF